MEPAELPADAVEVGRIVDAWGVKGWFKIQPHSADPQALFSSKRWYLQAPTGPQRAAVAQPAGAPQRSMAPHSSYLLRVAQARTHGAWVVASAHDITDRAAAEALRGCSIRVPRSSFPSTGEDEYYWVDLIGMSVRNRQAEALGVVADLMSTGPQSVLVVRGSALGGAAKEHLIPFVSAYVDSVDRAARTIHVDWQADYLD